MDLDNSNGDSHGTSASYISRQQYDVSEQKMSMLGKVTIEMERHDPIYATCLLVTLQELSWIGETGAVVLRHSFKDILKTYHTWRHAEQHNQWTMAFDHDEMQGCVVHCPVTGHDPHLKTMPNYSFSSGCDYNSVQSLLRGAPFIRDYETASIKCRASGSQASRKLCVKSWHIHADAPRRSLTIPVTVSTKAGYQLRHIDVQAQWMRWEKQDSRCVKLEFIQVPKKKSSADASTTTSRRSSFKFPRAASSSKPSALSDNATQTAFAPDQLASPEMAQKWQHFLLEFKDKKGNLSQRLVGWHIWLMDRSSRLFLQ